MPERNVPDLFNLRLPLYRYVAPLWQRRTVLEIGCGDGGSADYLATAGVERVVSIDGDPGRIERARGRHGRARVEFRFAADLRRLASWTERFDLILVPEGQPLLALPEALRALRGLLAHGGHMVMAVPTSDRKTASGKEGVGYYDLADAMAAEFPAVRMLGQTPFLGLGLVEFDGNADALRVDVSLLHGGTEPPSHFVAIAGDAAPPALGYALVQIPFAPVEELLVSARAAAAEPATPAVMPGRPDAKVEAAERRAEEVERRARARAEESDARLAEARKKLDEAVTQAEAAGRVSRAQNDEIEELRGRLRRMAEDRAAADADMGKLRRALAEADESVLTLTRRTAEGMAAVAEKISSGFGLGAGAASAATGELEARASAAEQARARAEDQAAELEQRLRATGSELEGWKQKAAGVGDRDERIARLEGEKQDLVWRVAELEEKLRQAEQDLAARPSDGDQVAAARNARDRAIEEFHRGAAAHANELHQLQSSVAEQAALVTELEDALGAAEARAAAADKEAGALRRTAKELEEADRARRGRLAELEGKLLRLERERAEEESRLTALAPHSVPMLDPEPEPASEASEASGASMMAPAGAGSMAELVEWLTAAEQRAVAAEQRAQVAEQRARAAEEQQRSERPAASGPGIGAAPQNGHGAAPAATGGFSPAPATGMSSDLKVAVADIEGRLRDEMRALADIEETLQKAREETTRAARENDPGVRAELERALAAKDSQLVEGRLEMARLRRDSELRQTQLEREIGDLRARLHPSDNTAEAEEHSQSAQLMLMHSTLANIRRRSARLRDELEGFRRRLDTLPPGALSSMLEEIGEDLAEFAK